MSLLMHNIVFKKLAKLYFPAIRFSSFMNCVDESRGIRYNVTNILSNYGVKAV